MYWVQWKNENSPVTENIPSSREWISKKPSFLQIKKLINSPSWFRTMLQKNVCSLHTPMNKGRLHERRMSTRARCCCNLWVVEINSQARRSLIITLWRQSIHPRVCSFLDQITLHNIGSVKTFITIGLLLETRLSTNQAKSNTFFWWYLPELKKRSWICE